MQAASCTFPSLGLTKGVLCLQRNICTGMGTTSSVMQSSSATSFTFNLAGIATTMEYAFSSFVEKYRCSTEKFLKGDDKDTYLILSTSKNKIISRYYLLFPYCQLSKSYLHNPRVLYNCLRNTQSVQKLKNIPITADRSHHILL